MDEARQQVHLRGEELYYATRHYAWAHEWEKTTEALADVVESGYFNYPALAGDPWLAPLRGQAGFERILQRAAARHAAAESRFLEAGGSRLLS